MSREPIEVEGDGFLMGSDVEPEQEEMAGVFGSDRPPSYWRARSAYIERFWWRVLTVIVVILVLGTVASWIQ